MIWKQMIKVKVLHYLTEETYQILLDLVHAAKKEGNKQETQSNVIEKALIMFNSFTNVKK